MDDHATEEDGESGWLSAAAAAARLGVKRDTLYAYVSRGLVSRHLSIDGRSSLFDPAEIDAFRNRRHRPSDGGLSTVIVSSITHITEETLFYRQTDVASLVSDDTDFEAVADLLWQSSGDWAVPDDQLAAIRQAQEAIDTTSTIDRFRITIALLSAVDPLRHDLSTDAIASAGRRMLTAMVDGLPMLGGVATDLPADGRGDRLSDRLWCRMTDQLATPAQLRCLNAILVLLCDHGLAASTFGVRVAASVRADPYSAVSAGLGVFRGAMHGEASAVAHRLIGRVVERGPAAALAEKLSSNDMVPGFGHVIYREQDPREVALLNLIRAGWPDDPSVDAVMQFRSLVTDRIGHAPNVDLALGLFTNLAGMGEHGGDIFAIARTVGWLAHAIEEQHEQPLRFRPVGRYIRPKPPPSPTI